LLHISYRLDFSNILARMLSEDFEVLISFHFSLHVFQLQTLFIIKINN
jgi:hypothetical protein